MELENAVGSMLWCQGTQNVGLSLSNRKVQSVLKCTVWSQCTPVPDRQTDGRANIMTIARQQTDASRANKRIKNLLPRPVYRPQTLGSKPVSQPGGDSVKTLGSRPVSKQGGDSAVHTERLIWEFVQLLGQLLCYADKQHTRARLIVNETLGVLTFLGHSVGSLEMYLHTKN